MNTFYLGVAERAGFRCEYCRAPERVFNFAFQVEHIYPVHLGGQDVLANLALSCESCNLYKGGAITGWDELSQQEVSLFHPRQQVWEEHFVWDATAGRIEGKTATGRATVYRLRFNSDFQCRARHIWAPMGLFP